MPNFRQSITAPRKRGYIYATSSVALVLFLLGIFGLILVHTRHLEDRVKESIIFTVELHDPVTTTETSDLEADLNRSRFVKPGSVRYVSKEEANQALMADFGDSKMVLDSNILSNSFEFKVKGMYMDEKYLGTGEPADTSGFLAELQGYQFVKGVYFQKIIANNVTANLQKVAYVLLALALLLMLVAIALIDNTIRLTLYADRFLIRNMQLVGATSEFIITPYTKRGFRQGITAGIGAAIGLLLTVIVIMSFSPEVKDAFNWLSIAMVLIMTIALGIGICTLSTRRGVSKYLKMKLDELYK